MKPVNVAFSAASNANNDYDTRLPSSHFVFSLHIIEAKAQDFKEISISVSKYLLRLLIVVKSIKHNNLNCIIAPVFIFTPC